MGINARNLLYVNPLNPRGRLDAVDHKAAAKDILRREGIPTPDTYAVIRRAGEHEWADAPHSHGYAENSRGIAVADMAYGLRSGREHRCNGQLAYHVLDVMHGVHDASRTGRHVELESTCPQPAPLPTGLREGLLDE